MKRPIKNIHLLVVAFIAIILSVISITIEANLENNQHNDTYLLTNNNNK